MAKDGVTVERVFAAPRKLVWALLADSNRYDRALGLGLAQYSWREIEGRRQMIGTSTQGGLRMEWIELPYAWIEGQFMEGGRIFLAGPALDGGVRVEVEDAPRGTLARVSSFGRPRAAWLKLLGPLVRMGLRRRIEAFLDGVASVLQARDSPDGSADVPAVECAQQMLSGRSASIVSGGISVIDAGELERRAARLSAAPVDPEIAARLVQALSERPDEELAQMRPFTLARAWNLPRRDVLRAFLHATAAGLVDLNWQINCPVCKVAASVVRRLEEVRSDVHCEACNIRYDVDFAKHIEAVFRCNRALRDVQPAVYCAASPAFRPHVIAQLEVPAGQTTTRTIDLQDGQVHVRTLGQQISADLVQPEPPERLTVRLQSGSVVVEPHGRAESGQPTNLEIVSELDQSSHVLIERGTWSADAALGSVIASMPDFMDLFATEAPATGLELSVGHLTLLFSDLTGSTALYERVGDARAYAVVQEHFELMRTVVAEHDGAIVKTMGDAVMATFDRPDAAAHAALDAVVRSASRNLELGIGIKLGVHEGPCLAVRANDRLDFFGTTVNIAARLQGKAESGELVLTRALANEASIARVLSGVRSREYRASLKGIESAQELVAFDLYAATEAVRRPAVAPTDEVPVIM